MLLQVAEKKLEKGKVDLTEEMTAEAAVVVETEAAVVETVAVDKAEEDKNGFMISDLRFQIYISQSFK